MIKKQMNFNNGVAALLPSVQKGPKMKTLTEAGERKRLLEINQRILILGDEDSNLTKRKLQYMKLLQLYDKYDIKKLTNVFKMFSQNGSTEPNKMQLFLTQQSILDNFKRCFLYFNESMALRFYNLLSEGVNMKRIYLPQYLMTLIPLFKGTLADKNLFVFRLLDGDNDGSLQSQDISDILKNVLVCPIQNEIKVCTCPLYNEVHELYKEYVHTNLLTYKVKKLVLDF